MRLHITIWDVIPERIIFIERNLCSAMHKLDIKGTIDSMSEPPLISRMNIAHRVPVLEIDNKFWSLKAHEIISEDECIKLLKVIHTS